MYCELSLSRNIMRCDIYCAYRSRTADNDAIWKIPPTIAKFRVGIAARLKKRLRLSVRTAGFTLPAAVKTRDKQSAQKRKIAKKQHKKSTWVLTIHYLIYHYHVIILVLNISYISLHYVNEKPIIHRRHVYNNRSVRHFHRPSAAVARHSAILATYSPLKNRWSASS